MQTGALLATGLPSRAIRLHVAIAAMSRGGKETAYATAATMAARMGVSVATYHRARRDLERAGLVDVTRRPDKPRRHRSNLFRLVAIGADAIAQAFRYAAERARMAVTRDRQKQSRFKPETLPRARNDGADGLGRYLRLAAELRAKQGKPENWRDLPAGDHQDGRGALCRPDQRAAGGATGRRFMGFREGYNLRE